jgi:hypothetical protein
MSSALKLPAQRALLEHIPIKNAKLPQIFEESAHYDAAFLDVRHPICQDIIFLLEGKAVRAGRFAEGKRSVLALQDALAALKNGQEGTLSLQEVSKVMLAVYMGTFVFRPTHVGLKVNQINFDSLLMLLNQKRFSGCLELKVQNTLNYLTFATGEPRMGFFAHHSVAAHPGIDPVRTLTGLADQAGEDDEVAVFESPSENEDEEKVSSPVSATQQAAPGPPVFEDEDSLTSDIQDLCIVALYEEVMQIISKHTRACFSEAENQTLWEQTLGQLMRRHSELLADQAARSGEWSLEFEKLLERKRLLPYARREKMFAVALHDLLAIRLATLGAQDRADCLPAIRSECRKRLQASRVHYEGNAGVQRHIADAEQVLGDGADA